MSRTDRIALILCLVAFLATAAVSVIIFEQMPHIEDEIAFTWQAKVIAHGKLTLPTPQPCPNCFIVPFVVDYQGLRFGKYPLGWPVVLALGEVSGARHLVNPFLASFSVWLIYLLVKRLTGKGAGLLAALLTVTSPFFLMNAGSLLSHVWSLFLSLAFSLAWLDAFSSPNPRLPERLSRWLPTILAALTIGVLALTRPLTAVSLALPFALHGIFLLVRGDAGTRRRLIVFGVVAGTLSLIHFAWQFAVTGDPFLNPYTLWWPYDTIGFGPGVGLQEGGYTLSYAWYNAQFSLSFGASDLFGWPGISWIFMPFGLIAILTDRQARRTAGIWLVAGILPSLILAYTLYWIGSWLYGPRYYFEGITSAILLTALGIRWIAGRLDMLRSGASPIGFILQNRFRVLRFTIGCALVSTLIISNLLYYTPARLLGMQGLYQVSRTCYQPFETPAARAVTPALVLVHVQEDWIEYGCMLDMSSPLMDSDFVFMISRGAEMEAIIAAQMPGRTVLHYYPMSRKLTDRSLTEPPQ